jgi:hypothetical protein
VFQKSRVTKMKTGKEIYNEISNLRTMLCNRKLGRVKNTEDTEEIRWQLKKLENTIYKGEDL